MNDSEDIMDDLMFLPLLEGRAPSKKAFAIALAVVVLVFVVALFV